MSPAAGTMTANISYLMCAVTCSLECSCNDRCDKKRTMKGRICHRITAMLQKSETSGKTELVQDAGLLFGEPECKHEQILRNYTETCGETIVV